MCAFSAAAPLRDGLPLSTRMRTDLERFFNPRAVAIIGASRDLDTISGQPLKLPLTSDQSSLRICCHTSAAKRAVLIGDASQA